MEELILKELLSKTYEEEFLVYLESLEYEVGMSPYFISYRDEEADPHREDTVARYWGVTDSSF